MVLTLVIPVRTFYGLKDMISERHLDLAARVMLATGLMVSLGYASEYWMAWYGDEHFDEFLVRNQMFGPYWPIWWTLMTCNVVVPQALWWRRVRITPWLLFIIAILVNVGMWAERFVIVVTSLHRDFLPSSWGMYYPTLWDWATLLGSIGLFFTLLFLFVRLLPMIAIAEMRKLTAEEHP